MKTYWNPYKRKTETVVGESGPELVNPPAGTKVTPVEKVDEPAKPTRAKKARKSK